MAPSKLAYGSDVSKMWLSFLFGEYTVLLQKCSKKDKIFTCLLMTFLRWVGWGEGKRLLLWHHRSLRGRVRVPAPYWPHTNAACTGCTVHVICMCLQDALRTYTLVLFPKNSNSQERTHHLNKLPCAVRRMWRGEIWKKEKSVRHACAVTQIVHEHFWL